MKIHITGLKFVALMLCTAILAAQGFLARPALAEQPAAPHMISPVLTGEPVAVSWKNPKKTHVFAIASNGSILTRVLDGTTLTWGFWISLGIPTAGREFVEIDAVSWTTGRIDLFGVDNEENVWHKYLINTTWLPQNVWEDIGTASDNTFERGIQAVAWAPGRLDIFTESMGSGPAPIPTFGGENPIYHKAWANGWWPGQTSWFSEFGNVAVDINVTSWGADRLDIVASNQSGNILHKAWNGSSWVPANQWTGLNFLDGESNTQPFSVSWGFNRLDVFARGEYPDSDVFHRSYNGTSWSPQWRTLGGTSTRDITGNSWGPNRIDIFEVRSSGVTRGVFHKAYDNAVWYPSETVWEHIGGESGFSDIAVSSWSTNRLDLFAIRNSDGSLWHLAWNGSNWTPGINAWELVNP